MPTGTDELLGAGKWGAGPTGVLVWQGSGWSIGILANHIWSFAGDVDRPNFDQTYLQPFVAYTTPKAWTFTLQSESTYDWETGEWFGSAQLYGRQDCQDRAATSQYHGGGSLLGGFCDTGPHGFGGRLGMTFLFPTQ